MDEERETAVVPPNANVQAVAASDFLMAITVDRNSPATFCYAEIAMGFMLGNLSVGEMQARSGVRFPQELIDYMKDRHQAEAENIKPGMWHCFDIPFTLVCGDMETAQEVFRHLSPLSSSFEQQMQISVASA